MLTFTYKKDVNQRVLYVRLEYIYSRKDFTIKTLLYAQHNTYLFVYRKKIRVPT